MRRYGLYDMTRGLTTAFAAGLAGLLLWVATQVGTRTEGRYWAAMGIVAGAGLIVALAQALGGWTKGLRLRLSPNTFALAFLPVLVCVGWVLLATQPGNGFAEGHIDSWSSSVGLLDVIHSLALWHGVLAFGFGLVLGLSFDAVPEALVAAAPAAERPTAADEPLTAERTAIPAGEPDPREPVERRRRVPVDR